MAATSDSSSPWRHGRNFWFFFFSMEAWPQTSNPLAILRKLLKTSNPTLFQTSYENFSKLLTKTSQNFQSCTLPILSQSYENFLRKLPIPPLLVTKTWNFQSSRKLPFPPTWKLEKSPLLVTKPRKLLKTFYENFLRKLLKTSNPTLFQYSTFGYENLKLPVPPTWKLEKPPILHSFYNFQSSTFGRKLETSDSSTFGYENLKLPVPPTWKLEKPPILHSSYNFQSSPTWTLMKSWFSATFPPKCVFWTKLGGFPQICPHFFFFDKMDFSSKL